MTFYYIVLYFDFEYEEEACTDRFEQYCVFYYPSILSVVMEMD